MLASPGRARAASASAASPSPLEATVLAAIIAVAALLRVREALRTPTWFDEIVTIWLARLSPRELLGALAEDVHPPLHFLMVCAWRALGGEGDLWLKSLSILIGLATIAVTWALARDLFGRGAAWIAAALLALHPDHVYFSQEVRNYVLLHFTVVLSIWRAWRWMESGRRRDAVLYALAATAALYTHYLAGLVLAFLGLWGLAAIGGDRRRTLEWVGIHLAVAVAFAPQLPIFVRQMALDREHWIRSATADQLLGLVRKLAFRAVYLIPPLFALALAPLLRARKRRSSALLWIVPFAPVLLAWALTRMGAHLFIERYMFFTLPAFSALVAAGLSGLPAGWVRRGAVAATLLFALRSTVISPPHEEAAALGQAATWLGSRLGPGDPVFCVDTHSFLFMRHHLSAGRARLLLMEPGLPYYEGARLIPDSLRATPAELYAARATGQRWWGVRTVHGGASTERTGRLLSAFAAGAGPAFGEVTLWTGRVD